MQFFARPQFAASEVQGLCKARWRFRRRMSCNFWSRFTRVCANTDNS
jgi:hypothetical protein